MMAMGPSPSSSSGCAAMCLKSGRRKASVFPLPVLAMPIMSLPLMMTGIACAWIGVGFSKLLRFRISRIFALTPHCGHDLIGFGTTFPLTLMPSISVRYSSTSPSVILASSGTSR